MVGCCRSQKRYFYCNKETGQTQWDYPESDLNASDDAMDISTTPPPPEDVNNKIIEIIAPPPPKLGRIVTPPPPIISFNNSEKGKNIYCHKGIRSIHKFVHMHYDSICRTIVESWFAQ